MEAEQVIFDFSESDNVKISDFIEDESNELALKWVSSWPMWPSNKLLLHGSSVCGKSQLAMFWLKLVNGVSVRNNCEVDLREFIDQNNAFLIDPLDDFLRNEHWLFDLINICTEQCKSILFVNRGLEFRSTVVLKDLASRLNSINSVRIEHPSDTLLKKVAMKIAFDLGTVLRPSVAEYLVQHISRDIESIKSILVKANTASLVEQKPIEAKLRELIQLTL